MSGSIPPSVALLNYGEYDKSGEQVIPAPFCVKENIPTKVFRDSTSASKYVAAIIASKIKERSTGRPLVLGLATGSTPTGVYDELVRMHKEEGLSFKNVVTFNLDEYYPMQPETIQSYHRFMKENLFDLIDIPPENIHIPDGTVPKEAITQHCHEYEECIKRYGGIDLQILGIGRSGHIGFNEPGSSRNSRTRLISLDKLTRIDAASDFFGEDNVPKSAITMGIGTILEAAQIIIMAFGEHKAKIVARTIEGEVTSQVPASFLQKHPSTTAVLDEAAGAELTRLKCPWTVKGTDETVLQIGFTDFLIRKAVIWLATTLKKPILKLTDDDYLEANLGSLISDPQYGRAYDINIRVFHQLQQTITGWPGGKPPTAPRYGSGPADALSPVFPKRVLIMSPHPDDDVISMGGTFLRLVEQGHEVHVAYQTSGNIAVWDADAVRFANFVTEYCRAFAGSGEGKIPLEAVQAAQKIEVDVDSFLAGKRPAQVDTPAVQKIKALIRQTEARAAARFCGVRPEHIHFLEMPFYETGAVKKKPLSSRDIELVVELFENVKPHQLYVAGDLSDPHGTHRVCLRAILSAIDVVKDREWFRNDQCTVWLYRGAWQEWEPERISMAVPVSPQELLKKRFAIFKHQSQKDRAPFPGSDAREFWQRAEDRNRATAKLFDSLGLAEYEAIEAFVIWRVGDPFKTNPVN